jgi:hypothetical protein
VGQTDSTMRRYRISAHATGVACRHTFASQPERQALSDLQSSQRQASRDLKGRRIEIDFINGLVAAKGAEVGIPAPTHAAITRLVRQVERGEIDADPRNVETL